MRSFCLRFHVRNAHHGEREGEDIACEQTDRLCERQGGMSSSRADRISMKRTFSDLVTKNVFHRRKEVCVATRFSPRPCFDHLSTGQACNSPTKRTTLRVYPVYACPFWPLNHRMCVIAKETGLSPLARTCSITWTFLGRLHVDTVVICGCSNACFPPRRAPHEQNHGQMHLQIRCLGHHVTFLILSENGSDSDL